MTIADSSNPVPYTRLHNTVENVNIFLEASKQINMPMKWPITERSAIVYVEKNTDVLAKTDR